MQFKSMIPYLVGGAICALLIFFPLINKYLSEWACMILGWHLEPKDTDFDGASLNGECPRCGKHVFKDSQGNWF